MNKENKLLTFIGIFVVLTIALVVSFNNNRLKGEEALGDVNTRRFAELGHYGFATAGNNNVSSETGEFILSYPQSNPNIQYSWLSTKQAITNEDATITDYNNFSGSYMYVDGNLKGLFLHYVSTSNVGKIVIVFVIVKVENNCFLSRF